MCKSSETRIGRAQQQRYFWVPASRFQLRSVLASVVPMAIFKATMRRSEGKKYLILVFS